jgi:catechol 2,3-dioxygenase-like lactoylglutathione lyase family enzyme
VKIPVTDLTRALDWYQRVFDAHVELEFPDEDGVVRGVAMRVPGVDNAWVSLRENPEVARGLQGFDPVMWGVEERADLEAWAEHLDALGISHSPVIDASVGWLLVFSDLDQLEHHLYTRVRHGIDQSHKHGYGRPT